MRNPSKPKKNFDFQESGISYFFFSETLDSLDKKINEQRIVYSVNEKKKKKRVWLMCIFEYLVRQPVFVFKDIISRYAIVILRWCSMFKSKRLLKRILHHRQRYILKNFHCLLEDFACVLKQESRLVIFACCLLCLWFLYCSTAASKGSCIEVKIPVLKATNSFRKLELAFQGSKVPRVSKPCEDSYSRIRQLVSNSSLIQIAVTY